MSSDGNFFRKTFSWAFGGKRDRISYNDLYNKKMDLVKQIKDNTTIDKRTQSELLAKLNPAMIDNSIGGIMQNISAEFQKAVEGTDPKYKARLATQQYYTALVNTPGKSQTRSGNDYTALMSNANPNKAPKPFGAR